MSKNSLLNCLNWTAGFILLALVLSQDIKNIQNKVIFNAEEGAMSKHIYSTSIFANMQHEDTTGSSSSLSLGKTMMLGVFDSDQEIHYGTALIQFQGKQQTGQTRIVIYVESVVVNTARTSFTVNLMFITDGVSMPSKYKNIGFHVIFIGSKFNLQSSPLSSGFARNSKLYEVQQKNNDVDTAQFGFEGTSGQLSPFDFIPTAANCGVSKNNNDYRIQVMQCEKPIILTFLTGFDHEIKNNQKIGVSAVTIKDTSLSSPSHIISDLVLDHNHKDYLYKKSDDDTDFGPSIVFQPNSTTKLYKVQMSLIFIGLRSFSPLNYPMQLKQDNFIIAVGGTTAMKTILSHQLADGLEQDLGQLNVKDYFKNSEPGHLFCGLQGIKNVDKIKLQIQQTANKITLQFIFDTDKTPFTIASCILISSKNPCLSQQKLILSSHYAVQAVTSPSAAVAMQLFTKSPSSKDMYQFRVSNYPTSASASSTIIKQYVIGDNNREFIFDVQVSNNRAPNNGQLSIIVAINDNKFNQQLVTTTLFSSRYLYHANIGISRLVTKISLISNPSLSVPLALQSSVFQSMSFLSTVLVLDTLSSIGNKCSNSCPEKPSTQVGISMATSPPSCIWCYASRNQHYYGGECLCNHYYYRNEDTQVCTPCSMLLCVTCDSTVCISCVANAIKDIDGACHCKKGYFRDKQVCIPCPPGCEQCTSLTTCSSCKDSINEQHVQTRQSVLKNCRCKPGFYQQDGNAICNKCSTDCLQCTDGTHCTKCSTQLKLTLQQHKCVCRDGYFMMDKVCIECSPICKKCSISGTYCTQCSEQRVLAPFQQMQWMGANQDGVIPQTCLCQDGYVEVNYRCVDESCRDIDPYCQMCLIDLNNNGNGNGNMDARRCARCGGNRQLVDGRCICQIGYYEQDRICKQCGHGCYNCVNATQCTHCAKYSINHNNGTCSCQSGFVIMEYSGGMHCQVCSSNCQQCQQNPSKCTKCKYPLILQSSRCQCPSGTYKDLLSSGCLACMSNCRLCTNFSSCQQCEPTHLYDSFLQQCVLSCGDGFYNAGSNCQACPTSCGSCVNDLICLHCNHGYFMYARSCVDVCPQGSFPQDNECYACPNQCSTCLSVNQCKSCKQQYVFFANKCLENCPISTYYSQGSCRICNPTCLNCSGMATYCTSCQSPKILFNNNCYDQCPVATVSGKCTDQCPSGSYLSGKKCIDCDKKCKTCSKSPENCTSCKSGLSFNGDCVDKCPSGSYSNNEFCVKCDISCRQCVQFSLNCLQCAQGFVKLGSNCIKNCSIGFYLDTASKQCKKCQTSCKQCTSQSRCTSCIDPSLSPFGNTCQKSCPSGSKLIGNNCVCNFGVLHKSVCISSCPFGFYASTDKCCLPCLSPCQTCLGSASTCLSCAPGYSYNASTKQCNFINKCQYGQFENGNGDCVNICQQGYFHNIGCIFDCPKNYERNHFNACVRSKNQTICTFPQYQQGSTCVFGCLSGFWASQLSRTCQKCLKNCVSCANFEYCLECKLGFILSQDQRQCLPSQQCQMGHYQYSQNCYQECPIGTYQSGNLCIRACQSGTYLYNGFCYSTCPTSFQTNNACVQSCPSESAIHANKQCRPTKFSNDC